MKFQAHFFYGFDRLSSYGFLLGQTVLLVVTFGKFSPTLVSLINDLSWTAGNHLIGLGAEIQRIDSEFGGDVIGPGAVLPADDFATTDNNSDGRTDDNDIPVLFAIRSGGLGDFPLVLDLDNTFLAGYIQDDWRISKNLTLNLGLRYELDTHDDTDCMRTGGRKELMRGLSQDR